MPAQQKADRRRARAGRGIAAVAEQNAAPAGEAAGAALRQAIDAALAQGGRGWRFEPVLEARFERETGAARARYLARAGAAGLGVAAAMAVAMIAAAGRWPPGAALAGALGAAGLAAALLAYARRAARPWRREWAAAACVALAALGVALPCPGDGVCSGAAALGILLLYANIVLRVRGAAGLAVTGGVLLAALSLSRRGLGGAGWLPPVLQIGQAGLGAAGNYAIEEARRRAYLLGLQRRIAAEDAARAGAAVPLAATDWLTGLANRRGFDARLAASVHGAAAACEPVALLAIDIDHFAAFNRAYGTAAGDACIGAIGAALPAPLRDNVDFVARDRGGGFAAILPRLDLAGAIASAERIRLAVEALGIEHRHAGATALTVSVGAAVLMPHLGGDAEQLRDAAEAALHAAKRRGRNRVHPPLLATLDLQQDAAD